MTHFSNVSFGEKKSLSLRILFEFSLFALSLRVENTLGNEIKFSSKVCKVLILFNDFENLFRMYKWRENVENQRMASIMYFRNYQIKQKD
jgi:hypothetical protein